MFATRWQPIYLSTRDWNRLRGEVERAFEHLTGTPLSHFTGSEYPALNLWEEDEQFVIEAEVPGQELETLEISVDDDNQLTLKGERKTPEWEAGTWHRQERAFGKFTRTLQLPRDVDADQVSAELKHGVLTITLPKKAEVKPRRIEVKTG